MSVAIDSTMYPLPVNSVQGPRTKVINSKEPDGVMSTSTPLQNNPGPGDLQFYDYNSYADWRARTYNQWTRTYDDNCAEENRLKIGAKPMKYFVNVFNSPQEQPFMTYTVVGNQKSYNVRNNFEREIPSRLNPLYDTQVLPYSTTPFLGQVADNRLYVDTGSVLRFGSDLKLAKSQNPIAEVDYDRWSPGVYGHVVQNAGQYGTENDIVQTSSVPNHPMQALANAREIAPGTKIQQPVNSDGYYNWEYQNNVLFMNSAVPYFGIASRNLLHNIVDITGC